MTNLRNSLRCGSVRDVSCSGSRDAFGGTAPPLSLHPVEDLVSKGVTCQTQQIPWTTEVDRRLPNGDRSIADVDLIPHRHLTGGIDQQSPRHVRGRAVGEQLVDVVVPELIRLQPLVLAARLQTIASDCIFLCSSSLNAAPSAP